MTFLEHTYERRQRFSSLWTADELVWGEIGPKLTTGGHDYDHHYKQLYPSHTNALPDATKIIDSNLVCILNRPYRDFEDLYDFIEQLLSNPTVPSFNVSASDQLRFMTLRCESAATCALVFCLKTMYMLEQKR